MRPVHQSDQTRAGALIARFGQLAETFSEPVPYTWVVRTKPVWKAHFSIGDQRYVASLGFAQSGLPDGEVTVSFGQLVDRPGIGTDVVWKATGNGNSFAVLATVIAALRDYIQVRGGPTVITFAASKEVDDARNRSRLYTRMVGRYAKEWGYVPELSQDAMHDTFVLRKIGA